MMKKTFLLIVSILLLLVLLAQVFPASPVLAAGATGSVHIVKYADDGVTVLSEKTVSYQWMKDNLPVYGDGVRHYYHQGPTFDPNNLWDPDETLNLKDKGAVMGSSIKDLCDLVGGMTSGDEVMMHAVDNWTIKFKYANIYQPQDRQGTIALCWYNGEDALYGEQYGEGYPSNGGYRTALQIIIMTNTTNSEGQYVFGNADMQVVMPPEEGYSHFYRDAEGFWPSTNGLSGKWINAIYIYSTSAPPDISSIDNEATTVLTQGQWDLDGDHVCNICDVVVIGLHWGETGTPAWIPEDVNNDGVVDMLDVTIIELYWGKQNTSTEDTNWNLTLVGSSNQTVVLSLSEIEAMTPSTGQGGFFTTTGIINGPYDVTGVSIPDLCDLVGGIGVSDIVLVSATDGYSSAFDYNEVEGAIPTYDPVTMKEVPHEKLGLILMYEQDGEPLSYDDGKPLRLAVVGSESLLTEGFRWVKWVNEIKVVPLD